MTSVGVMASSVVTSTTVDVLMEPFNNFTDAPWTVTSTPTIVAGRTGTAMQAGSTAQRVDYSIPVGVRSDTITLGFAWRRTDVNTNLRHIFHLWTNVADFELNRFTYTPSTNLLIFGRLTTTVASATITLTQNTWYYIEVQAKLGDAPNGSVIVRVDGVEVINATGIDTNPRPETVYGAVRVWTSLTGGVGQWDDLYLTTGAGAPFKGAITIP